jgi:ABC-type transport system substrate-binding protein
MAALSFSGCTKKVDDKDTTLTIPLRVNVKGLDPIQADDLYSNMVVRNVFEGLYEYHYLKRPFTLQPALAESLPEVTDNGLTVTIKLKKGVKFQDNACFSDGKGREVVAEDFIYSFRRLADPKSISNGFWIFDGKIKGLNAWVDAVKAGKADFKTPIEGLQAPDKHTLVIKLVQPYYQLNYVLAMGFASVVPREAVEKYGAEFLNNPVGTGPYMLEKAADWIRNSKITLKKNSNWRGQSYPSEGETSDQAGGLLADAGKALPFADTLVFTEMIEDQPRWQNFMKGNLDCVLIPNDNYDSAIKDNRVLPELTAKGLSLDNSTAIEVTFVGFNLKDPLLGKNKDLRRALSLAMDSVNYIKTFDNGRGVPAQSPIPLGLEGYDPEFKNPWAQFNVNRAKEFLAKAGFQGGKGLPELTLEGLSGSKDRQIDQYFASLWAAIGVKIKINSNTWPQFQEKIKRHEAQIFSFAWAADYPDPQNFLQLFYSKNFSPGPNDTSFSDPEFDRLYEKALTLPVGKERTELYKKMRDIVVEENPWIFIRTRKEYRLVHGWVGNFKWNQIESAMFKYIKVDPKKRAELKGKL